MRRILLVFLVVACTAVTVGAQAEPSAGANTGVVPGSEITGAGNVVDYAEFARPRRMIFYFEADREGFSAFDRTMLYRSVLMAAGDANPNVVLLESPEIEVPGTHRGMEELARQIDADCWLLVSVTGEMSDARIEIETFDILKQKRFGARVIRPGYPLDYRTLASGFWDSTVETIRNDYGAVVDTLRVRIVGVPGTHIENVVPRALIVGSGGSLDVTLPNPATYSLYATAPGYYPVEDTFYLGYDSKVVRLKQTRAARFGIDVAFDDLQFPGVRFWYFPVPATLFVRGGFTTYALGLYFIDSTQSILRGNPLTRLFADSGWYLSPPGKPVRFYAGGGASLRVAHGRGFFGVDPYAPVGADGVVGIEYSPSLKLHVFAEYAPIIYYTPDSDEFRLISFPQGNPPAGYLFFTRFSIDLRNFNIGVRYTW